MKEFQISNQNPKSVIRRLRAVVGELDVHNQSMVFLRSSRRGRGGVPGESVGRTWGSLPPVLRGASDWNGASERAVPPPTESSTYQATSLTTIDAGLCMRSWTRTRLGLRTQTTVETRQCNISSAASIVDWTRIKSAWRDRNGLCNRALLLCAALLALATANTRMKLLSLAKDCKGLVESLELKNPQGKRAFSA